MSKTKGRPGRAVSPGPERRSTPRFRFTARVEVTDHLSDIILAGRIVEISQMGCYVNTLGAPAEGTRIRLRITHGLDTFKTAAEVKRVEPGVGMGVQFLDTPEDQQHILSAWLAELSATG
jgi:PilZ domain